MHAEHAKQVIHRLVRELRLCNRKEEIAALTMLVQANITLKERVVELEREINSAKPTTD